MSNKPPDDSFQIRCPKLGHQIHFSYCRSENLGQPCIRILNCWFRYFDVENYLRKDMTTEEFARAFQQPLKSKVQSLMELIDQAQKRKKEQE